ncbi:hypothetical protein Y1Q_0015666 [Alligator mississippiensis]|uniref:Uncharacterized protein n=1 Tax=Alligator mississippiensis TaxID=8496 RepID=A0A151NNK3_ALLMI|nr:hypothetical protein Y1Q_0015666 [Alligator mississippiensis]
MGGADPTRTLAALREENILLWAGRQAGNIAWLSYCVGTSCRANKRNSVLGMQQMHGGTEEDGQRTAGSRWNQHPEEPEDASL